MMLLNPKKRRRRSRKASRRAAASRRMKAYWRRRRSRGAARSALSGLICQPRRKRARIIRSLEKSCPVRKRRGKKRATGAPKHGGIAGIIAAGRAPAVIAANRGRRRRRNYSHWLPAYTADNPSYVPAYAMRNPGVVGTLTRGFSPSVIMGTLPVIGGALGNAALSSYVGRMMPSMLRSGVGNLALGVATAGLMGAGVGMVSPRLAKPIFFGGLVEVMTRVVSQYVLPLTQKAVATVKGLGYFSPMGPTSSALGYFSPMGPTSSALGCAEPGNGATPVAEELVVGDYAMDELVPYEAAVPLHPSDAAIEGTAQYELAMS